MSSITDLNSENPIAYFCAEFGIDDNLPLYAGGLGVLAGDTLKQAADQQVQMIGVGLLYRGYNSHQTIDETGKPSEKDDLFDPLSRGLEHVYIDDQPLFVRVHLTEVDVWLRCWKKTLGPTVTLYLLDSETDQNLLTERCITQELYAGSQELQVKQQLVLGIGGVKLLKALGIKPSVYHLNEGRAAFLQWQLIRELMDIQGIDYVSAAKIAKQKIVYTNHTLMAAGNKGYDAKIVEVYARYYADKMHISLDHLLADGIEHSPTHFNMTRFSLNISRISSGVSQLHTNLSQAQWPEYHWVNVTNGVHMPTWQDQGMKTAVDDDRQLWYRHLELKQQLQHFVAEKTGYSYNPHSLVITWARRLTGYKRPEALFADIERLKKILTISNQPVQILLSGKTHQGDSNAKDVLQSIVQQFQTELSGFCLYVPDYSLAVARQLVAGSDLWLNTPELGKEACGTSGMKAISNGVLQCTVKDGWAAEVDWNGIGWELDSNAISESVYSTLESQIIPTFYDRNDGVPFAWIERMKKSIQLSNQYSAARMVQEYCDKLYCV